VRSSIAYWLSEGIVGLRDFSLRVRTWPPGEESVTLPTKSISSGLPMIRPGVCPKLCHEINGSPKALHAGRGTRRANSRGCLESVCGLGKRSRPGPSAASGPAVFQALAHRSARREVPFAALRLRSAELARTRIAPRMKSTHRSGRRSPIRRPVRTAMRTGARQGSGREVSSRPSSSAWR